MNDSTTFFAYAIALILAIVLMYFLFRWIFDIKRQLWNQQAQITLLIKIADKLGVPLSDIEVIDQMNKKD